MGDTVRGRRPGLVGIAVEVPLVSGEMRRYVNLDYAASTPALSAALESVNRFAPYYSSVHRGAGFKSQVSTAAYEGARSLLLEFFGGRPGDVAIFTRNTTDSVNLLATCLPAGATVLTFAAEHHANLLPWRRQGLRTICLPIPSSTAEAIESLDAALNADGFVDLVAVTGASNVTGELWPIRDLARVAHRHGSRILMDAAQIAPHRPVSLSNLDVDYLVASAHKMYAPFGVGLLAGRTDWLDRAEPYLRGGGAVDFVTQGSVQWTDLPARQEAGSPNVIGAVGFAAAVAELDAYGMDRLWMEEREQAAGLRRALAQIPGVRVYALWPDAKERTGVVAFNIDGYDHSLVATVLSAEYGIGVRHGCFCAHPLMLHLLEVPDHEAEAIRARLEVGERRWVPGAVRLSVGLGTTQAELEYFLESIRSLASQGPHAEYELDANSGDYVLAHDARDAETLAASFIGAVSVPNARPRREERGPWAKAAAAAGGRWSPSGGGD
jgi:selenocysteine lyase/cysteine desulfurase